MKNKKENITDGQGVKAFLQYLSAVVVVILIAVSIKALFILKQSRYDGSNLVLVVSQKNKVVAVFDFNSSSNSISVFKIINSSYTEKTIGKNMGVIADAWLDSDLDYTDKDPGQMLLNSIFPLSKIKTNLTIYDSVRLLILAKGNAGKNIIKKEINLLSDERNINKIVSGILTNDKITDENISIEIRNATDIPGLGKRLEKSILNLGGNIVSVSTSNRAVFSSAIEYSGNEGYTVRKLKMILNFPLRHKVEKGISDITIVIGEDSKNTEVF